LVCHGLGDVALAGAGLANDECVGAFADELRRVQLEARLSRQLRVEAQVDGQGESFFEPRTNRSGSWLAAYSVSTPSDIRN
jgi:hypothetical protein